MSEKITLPKGFYDVLELQTRQVPVKGGIQFENRTVRHHKGGGLTVGRWKKSVKLICPDAPPSVWERVRRYFKRTEP